MNVLLGNPLLMGLAALAALGIGLLCLRHPSILIAISIFTVSLDYMGRIADTMVTYNNLLKLFLFVVLFLHMMSTDLRVRVPKHLLLGLPFVIFVGITALHGPALTKGSFLFLRLVSLWLFALAVANLVRTRRDLAVILASVILSTIISSLFAHLQTLNMMTYGTIEALKGFEPGDFGVRAVSTFWNPNRLALYLLNLSIFLLVVLHAPKLRGWLKLLMIAALVMALVAILLTFSRAAWVSLSFAGLLLLRFRETRRVAAIMIGVAGTAVLAVAVLTPYGAALLERAGSFGQLESDFSTRFRLYLGLVGLDIWSEGLNWLWGAGYASFPVLFTQHLHPMMSHEMAYHSGTSTSHMLYATLVAETGLIGTLLFALFIYGVLKELRLLLARVGDPILRLTLIGTWILVVVRIVDWLFNPSIAYNEFWFALGLIGAISFLIEEERQAATAAQPSPIDPHGPRC